MDSTFSTFAFNSSIMLQDAHQAFYTYYPGGLIDTIPALPSLVLTFLLLAILILTKCYTDPLQRMVFFLILVDFLFSLSLLVSLVITPSSSVECKTTIYISVFGRTSSFFWSASFAHALMKIMEANNFTPMEKLMKYYTTFSLSLPAIIALVFVSTPLVVYDPDDKRCGRYVTIGQFDYSYFLLSGVPLLLSCVMSIYFYLRTGWHIKSFLAKESGMARELLVLMVYPATMIVCWLPYLIWNLVYMFIDLDSTLAVIPKFCLGLHGFLNSLAYGLSKKTREDLKSLCAKSQPEDNSQQTEPHTATQELSFAGEL